MRLNKRVKFLGGRNQQYDPETSKNQTVFTKQSEWYPCHVSDIGMDRSQQIFGDYKRHVKVFRLQVPLADYRTYSQLLFENRHYEIRSFNLDGRVFYAEEVAR